MVECLKNKYFSFFFVEKMCSQFKPVILRAYVHWKTENVKRFFIINSNMNSKCLLTCESKH
jgi:hypothetical protein